MDDDHCDGNDNLQKTRTNVRACGVNFPQFIMLLDYYMLFP
jgi:hypothetical protein